MSGLALRMHASDWRPLKRGTLQGFVTLHLPSCFTIKDCTVHQHANGARWVGLPGRPQIDRDGNVRRAVDGKVLYVPVVEVEPSHRAWFQAQALEVIDQLIGQQVTP